MSSQIVTSVADQERKRRAALSSVAASGALTLVKLAAGLLSGSLALLSEAVHGAVDTGATLVTFFAVSESGKPADEDHHYGHDKFEALAALIEVFLLVGVAVVVVFEASRRLIQTRADVDLTVWVFGALLLSIGVDFFRWQALRRVAIETRSDALAADAVHFSSDLIASLIVLAGLLAYAAGWRQADTVASFGVAGFIAFAAFRLARQTVETLLDKAPEGLSSRLSALALAVPGTVDIVELRLRKMGGRTLGDMTVGVPRTLTSERTVAIREAVNTALRDHDPMLDIAVVTVPRTLNEETIFERILLVAARRRLSVHHVTIQHIEGRPSISFDLEVDGAMTLGEAHEAATGLETAIRAEIGTDIEVESHIEPLLPEFEGRDESPDRVAAIAQRLSDAARPAGIIYDIHKVRARRSAEGLVINYHCRADPSQSINAVHDHVDLIEHAVRGSDSEIVRLVGHAEPPRSYTEGKPVPSF